MFHRLIFLCSIVVGLVGCASSKPDQTIFFPDGSKAAALRCWEAQGCFNDAVYFCPNGFKVLKEAPPSSKDVGYYWLLVKCEK